MVDYPVKVSQTYLFAFPEMPFSALRRGLGEEQREIYLRTFCQRTVAVVTGSTGKEGEFTFHSGFAIC
jgi:hypothetical protein